MIDAIAMAISANERMLFPFVAGADGRSLKGWGRGGLLEGFQVTEDGNPMRLVVEVKPTSIGSV